MKDLLKLYEPEAHKVRMGRDHDGGYVICDVAPYDAFLSAGIGADVSFEYAVLTAHPELKCSAFDPHIAAGVGAERLILHQTKVGRLPNGKNVLVKMDIEGDEYSWFKSISDTDLLRIKQLVLEVHEPFTSDRQHLLRRLAEHFHLVHIHGNNFRGLRRVGAVLIPEVFEATYIRKDVVPTKPVSMKIPTVLDYPNDPSNFDLVFRI